MLHGQVEKIVVRPKAGLMTKPSSEGGTIILDMELPDRFYPVKC